MRRLSAARSPHMMQVVNGWLTIFWVAMVPVSWALGWLESVTYVSALSLWALVSGHWAAWEAARVDARADADSNVDDALEHLRTIEQLLEQHQITKHPEQAGDD